MAFYCLLEPQAVRGMFPLGAYCWWHTASLAGSATFLCRSECQSPPVLQQPSGLHYQSSTSSALQKVLCILFLDLISSSFPVLLPAQCSSTLLVSFQILLQIQDFLENPQLQGKVDKNSGPKQKYLPMFQTLKEHPLQTTALSTINIANVVSRHQFPAPGSWQALSVALVWLEQPQFHFQRRTGSAVSYSSASFTARQRLERSRAFSKWKMKLQPAEEQH